MQSLTSIVLSSYDASDGAVQRNIDACRTITSTVSTSFGPYGRNKIVINHLQKLILTNDAATILRELDVVHPAAKMLVMACQQQENELGDGTNLVMILAGEMLKRAEELLRMGLTTADINAGYEKGMKIAIEALDTFVVENVENVRDARQLTKALRSVIGSKQAGHEDLLARLVAEAVLAVLPKVAANFNVDNVRVVKIMGGSLAQSTVVRGMVFGKEPDGAVKKIASERTKVGVYSCPIDISQTETKGTVLLQNAKQMLGFTTGEEVQMENIIKELHDSGLRVIIAGSTVGELALHYINRAGILLLKVPSKFELRRICRVVGATPLARLGAPMPDEMGQVDVVETLEMGGDRVTVFRQESDATTRTATIVLRGATQNHLDDLERAVDDGVNVVKAITKDSRLVPGAGAVEVAIAEAVSRAADKTPGLAEYAVRKFGEAFEVVPRLLAESAGLDATEVLARLYNAHAQTVRSGPAAGGKKSKDDSEHDENNDDEDSLPKRKSKQIKGHNAGVDVLNESGTGVLDVMTEGILDLLVTKHWAIKLATEAARTVLSVDQIIVARQAGGPKPPGPNPNWDED